MCDFSDFVQSNSGFILTVFGLVSACLGSAGVCILRSRCTTIKCCGASCERAVLSESVVTADNASIPAVSTRQGVENL